MKKSLVAVFAAIFLGAFFTGYCANVQARPAQSVTGNVVGAGNENLNCKHLMAKVASLRSREDDLKTALEPEKMHLARTASLTGLNSAKASELESQLAKVRNEKREAFKVMEARGCQ
jgi:hypothetical protein